MINPAKPEVKAARPRTCTTLWDMISFITDASPGKGSPISHGASC
jgi:hypothetical protein